MKFTIWNLRRKKLIMSASSFKINLIRYLSVWVRRRTWPQNQSRTRKWRKIMVRLGLGETRLLKLLFVGLCNRQLTLWGTQARVKKQGCKIPICKRTRQELYKVSRLNRRLLTLGGYELRTPTHTNIWINLIN